MSSIHPSVRRVLAFTMCALLIGTAAPATLAENTTVGQSRQPVPLQVDVVLTRSKDNTEVSRLPFTLLVTANDPSSRTSVRMGVQVPVPTQRDGAVTINYQNVGTQIDASAESSAAGFDLTLGINDSSLYESSGTGDTGPSGTMGGYPVIRSFFSQTKVGIRDGQSREYTMATDKISGEVMRVTVTLTVLN